MHEFLKLVILAVLLLSGDLYSGFLGALLEAVFNFSMRIPYAGPIIKVLIFDFVKLVTVVKIFSWYLSSAGVLLGFIIFSKIYSGPVDQYGFIIILVVTLRSLINILFEMCEFKIIPYTEAVIAGERMLKNYAPKSFLAKAEVDQLTHQGLSRSIFVSLHLPRLFRLLICVGMAYFSLAHLGFIQAVKAAVPDLKNCMMSAFSFVPVVTKPDPLFTGDNWTICNILTAFLVFFWTVFFLSAAQSMFMDEAKLVKVAPAVNIYQENYNENIEVNIERETKN